ncbi:Uncharacterised protein [Bordetella pertussis]|nr:Uncharacterised protein [Bordetella pertussis]
MSAASSRRASSPPAAGAGWAAGTASTAGIEVQSSSLTRSIISAPNAI